MCKEPNNVPVGVTSNTQQVVEQPQNEENQALKEYYLRLLRLMYPTMPTDKPDNTNLVILRKRTARLVEMLTLFDRSWTETMPVIQKACLLYMTTENIPKKERERIVDAWGDWTTFLFEISRYRGLLAQFRQYHHRQMQDFEKLLNRGGILPSSEIQHVN